MNRIISLSVEDMYIKYTGEAFGATGSHNAVTLRMTFGPAWEGTAKTAYFTDALGNNSVALVLGLDTLTEDGVYEVDVPSEALKIAGVATVTIKGVLVSGETTTRAITTAAGHFRVLDSELPDSAGNAGTITASDKEQLQAEIAGMETLFTTARAAAETAAENAKTSETNAKASETAAAASAASAAESKAAAAESAATATAKANAAGESAAKAAASQTAAKSSEDAAKSSETAAKAAQSAAETAEGNAESSATAAAGSAQTAQSAASTAAGAASSASTAATAASGSASQAQSSAAAAAESAASVDGISKTAQSWAVGGTGTREGEDTNNAKYWAEQAETTVGGDFATKNEAQGYVTNHNQSSTAHSDIREALNGKEASGTAAAAVSAHNADTSAHADIRIALDGKENAGAVAEVQSNLTAHAGNTTVHVTSAERASWNGKAAGKHASQHGANGSDPITPAAIGAIASTAKGAAGGVASLDTSGKVPSSQLPEISSVKTYTATIGTTWAEDENTGAKTQNVAIPGILASHTIKVDHDYTGSGTSEDYATFAEEENQYLTCITNGYAESYDGGIKFTIFGDTNTVQIPIVVEASGSSSGGSGGSGSSGGTGAEVYYIDLTGDYPHYTCATAMSDIAAAYAAGRELKCRCAMGNYTAVLPLFLPLPSANTWVFSGSGALATMGFAAQSLTIAIVNGTVQASNTQLASKDDIPTIPATLPNPKALTVKTSSGTVTYDGSEAKTVEITGGSDTPDYVLTAADALAKKVTGHIGADNIVFAVMSDAHLGVYTDTANAAGQQAGQALQRLNERCALDFVAHCGDYTTGAWNTDVEATLQDNADYQLLIGSKYPGKAIWVVGNHDDAPYQATDSRMTQTQVYAAIARKNLASGGVVPDNACYGYTDFPGMRLRVIYLDTHDRRGWASAQVGAGASCDYLNIENISGAQLKWLVNHALDFSGVDDPSKWSILVFSHAVLGTSGTYTDPSGTAHPCNTSHAAAILKAYATKKSGVITHGGVEVSYNFTETVPAGIIGCIHGHEHRYADETVGGAFLSICCPNITNGRERASADGNTYTKTAGTANGTSFCVFSINRADKKIYVDHYGPGIDREFDYTVLDPSAPSYTNLLPSATDTDGSIYNGVGYAAGQRLNSSGTAEGYTGIYLTGFIPVSLGDVVHLKNVTWQYGVTSGITSNNQRISFYDASHNHLGQTNGTGLGGTLSGVKDDNNIWTQFTVKNFGSVTLTNVAYFRICCAGITDESIITVNEEIT